MEELDLDPPANMMIQKAFRIPGSNLILLSRIKQRNNRMSHNFVVSKILEAVLPRVLEKMDEQRQIDLTGIRVSL